MKKYESIVEDIEGKILDKTYKINQLLPSENELTNQYACSRATVRQALGILEDKGLIHRQQGKGSLVIAQDKLNFPISGLVSYKELQDKLSFESQTEVLKFEQVTINQELADLTLLEKGAKAWHILRKRSINGQASVLDMDYILYDVAPFLSSKEAQNSIYEYLENDLGISIAYAQKEMTIDFVSRDDNKYLDLPKDDRHVVSVKSHVFLDDTSPFQYTESRHQVDKFRFTEFARRQKK